MSPARQSAPTTTISRSEFFTPAPVVRHMSDLCEPLLSDPARKVFEPGCGNGNFLVEALSRRLSQNLSPVSALISLSNLYGVDIDSGHLSSARDRLKTVISAHFSEQPLNYRFWPLVELFLNSNLIQGDLLHGLDKITFIDWQQTSDYNFRAVPVHLIDLLGGEYV